MGQENARVCIVAPPGRLRDSLRVLLRANEDIEVVGIADDIQSATGVVEGALPDLVLLDAGYPDCDMITMINALKAKQPEVHCCVLAHTRDQEQGALEMGAGAVLQDGFSARTFWNSIQELIRHSPIL